MRVICATIAALVAATCASEIVWFGMTQAERGANVEVYKLGRDAVRQALVSSVPVSADESVKIDGFRCRPMGFICIFNTETMSGVSFMYNVSTATGQVLNKEKIAADLYNLNLFMQTGAGWTVADYGNGSAGLVAIDANGVEPLVDLTPYLQPGDQFVQGGMTSCSNNGDLWIIARTAKGTTRLFYTSSIERIVHWARELNGYNPSSLWAHCNDQTKTNNVAGIVQLGNQLTYGYFNDDGSYKALAASTIPEASPAWELTHVLSEALFPSLSNYYTLLYPAGTPLGANTTGLMATGGYRAGSEFTFTKIDWYLIGGGLI